MIRQGEPVFVDSGAWIALALSRDPLHAQAREQWDLLRAAGARLHTSVPVVIETFTFLDRNANRDVALAWKGSAARPGTLNILPCDLRDLQDRGNISGVATCINCPPSMPLASRS